MCEGMGGMGWREKMRCSYSAVAGPGNLKVVACFDAAVVWVCELYAQYWGEGAEAEHEAPGETPEGRHGGRSERRVEKKNKNK